MLLEGHPHCGAHVIGDACVLGQGLKWVPVRLGQLLGPRKEGRAR